METRKNIRLKEYDYTKKGYYFITLCSKNMQNLFGELKDFKMQYNDYGNKINNKAFKYLFLY